jgi:hypothetical protein
MFPVPIGNFPPQEVWTSVDSGETYPMEWWWNNYVLTGNPDGTVTAETKFSAGIPPMTLRRIESPPRPFMGLEYTTEFRSDDQVLIGCGDKHSSDYNPNVEVHDNDRCGPCVQGYTRTEHTHCWKVGWRLIDCKTGEIYYRPKGYHQNCEETGGKDRHGLCYVQDYDYYEGLLGRDIMNTPANFKKQNTKKSTGNYINTTKPTIKYKPTSDDPLYKKSYTGSSWSRVIVAFRNDGTPIVKHGQGSKTNWPGVDSLKWIQGIRDKGCEGKWVELTDEQAAKVPTFLGSGGGLGETVAVVLPESNIDDDDSNESPIVRDPVGGSVEPETTNWTPLIAIGAVAVALPILFGGRE